MGRPRNWTDEQLREAVATSSAWNEVVRKIGRKPGPAARRTVRGHVARLALDVSHLPPLPVVEPIHTGRLLISSDELRHAVANSASWVGVIRNLGQAVTGDAYARVKRQVLSEGLDISHFTGQAWNAEARVAAKLPFTRCKDEKNLHKVGASAACQWFLGRGYMVSVPVEPVAYDLVVESDRGLERVQVKTTRTLLASGRHVVGLVRSQYGREKPMESCGRYGRRAYRDGEVDYFFVYTSHGEMYLIPLHVVAGRRDIVLDTKYAMFRLGD